MASLPRSRGTVLCSICANIDVRKPYCGPAYGRACSSFSTRVLYQHGSSLAQLEKSARNNDCHLCHLILDVIRKYNDQDEKTVRDDWEDAGLLYDEVDNLEAEADIPLEIQHQHQAFFHKAFLTVEDIDKAESPIILDITFRDPTQDELASRCVDVAVHWTQPSDSTRQTTSALSLVSGLQENLVKLCEARDVQNDSSTGAAFSTALARRWMQQCDEEHEVCNERRRQHRVLLPSRVIDVGDDNRQPFLLETQISLAADYVCLSHCWGTSQHFKTEKASLYDRQKGMDVSKMPRTFQDALSITRNLGIQYLWIDSLCIVQDSPDDWARESAQMGRIYRDATITIFAAAADGDDGGCFMPRSGRDTALCRTPVFDDLVALFTGSSLVNMHSFIQAKLHHAGATSMPDRHHMFETVRALDPRSGIPLNQRGWVLQESILSFRSLIYDRWEVRWWCPASKACECVPEGFSRQSHFERDRRSESYTYSNNTRELFNSWSYIIKEFTLRKLSFSKDKLPALAGMATEMSHANRSSYFAGLWKENLRENLAWRIPPESQNAPPRSMTRSLTYRAPSWSWASMDCGVVPIFDFGACAEPQSDRIQRATALPCEIINCWTEPTNRLNPFGEVQSGALVLRGNLGHAHCGMPVTDAFHLARIPLRDAQSGEDVRAWFDPDVTSTGVGCPINEVWCIPLHHAWDRLQCLALVPATSPSTGTSGTSLASFPGKVYTRVGVISPKSIIGRWIDSKVEKRSIIVEDPEATATNTAFVSWLENTNITTITVI